MTARDKTAQAEKAAETMLRMIRRDGLRSVKRHDLGACCQPADSRTISHAVLLLRRRGVLSAGRAWSGEATRVYIVDRKRAAAC